MRQICDRPGIREGTRVRRKVGPLILMVCSVLTLSRSGLEMLRVIPVSKAQAIQRAGRAGRDVRTRIRVHAVSCLPQGPGVCFRLYTEDWFTQLPEVSVPEIKRYCNVAK